MAPGRPGPALEGRADALGSVSAAIQAALGGAGGGLVLLEGEAGIGKSRLIGEAADQARTDGVAVAIGAADPLALSRPFGALIDALDLTPTSPDPDRAHLGELLFGDLAGSGTGPGQRDVQYLVQEGLIALLERLAASEPLLVALDDLQWSDRATLAAVVAISRRVGDLPLVMILGTRPTPRSPEMDQAIGRLVDLGGTLVRLGPLPADAVRALAAGLLGGEAGPALLEQLQGCGGNPFFVIETIRTLEEDGLIEAVDGVVDIRDRALPAPLRSSLLRRVDAISPSAQEALRMAAVLGSTFAVDDLAALLQRSVAATATATHEAVRAGFLEESGPYLAFRHDLIREALYEDLPRAIRSALHRDAADALADRAPIHVIAQHLALGAEPGDVEAVAWLRRAATEAGPRDPATAVDLLQRAIDLQDVTAESRAALRRELVDALAWAGHLDTAETEAKAALADIVDPTEECALRLALARCRLLQGNSLGALHQLELASASPALDDRARAWIAADSATARFVVYDLERTVREATEAVRGGEELDDRALQVAGLGISCRVATMRGEFEEAFALGERAVAIAGDDARALRRLPHLYLGVALYDGDRSSEAILTMREGIRHSEEIGAAWALPRQHNTLVAACFYAGAWDDALAEAEAGVTLAGEVGSRAWLPQAQCIAGTIAFHRGELATARAALDAARAEMEMPGSDAGGLGWMGPLEALLLEADGDFVGAFGAVLPVYELAVELGVATRAQRLAPQLVRLALAVGDRDGASVAAAAAEARGGPSRPSAFRGAAAYCQGLIEGDGDRLLEAADHYRESSPIDFVLSARTAGELLDVSGRRDRARSLLEESLSWCTKLGADLHGHAISAVLDAWAGPAPQARYHDRPVTGWEALTPAEEGVAELVGDGLSNAEIAERLFISRRTVESHVAHVYQKLQIKGRVALAIEVANRA